MNAVPIAESLVVSSPHSTAAMRLRLCPIPADSPLESESVRPARFSQTFPYLQPAA
jgi:hypothetical protein